MKTGDKVRIIKLCAPFIGEELFGKISKITIYENGSIYLDDIKIFISPYWIELVNEDSDIIVENRVYAPIIVSKKVIPIKKL